MEIIKTREGDSLKLVVEGRLDTVTAPQLEKELKDNTDGIRELEFDFEKLQYISSAGLRVLLSAQKMMNKQGSMKVCHVNSDVLEVFDITGFVDILTIE